MGEDARTELALAVFCGTSKGSGSAPARAVDELVTVCASRGIRIVYGGSDVGLMGRVARIAQDRACAVTGVTPHHLAEIEPPARDIEMVYVDSMAERKEQFADLADAVLVLPGGIGTLDEAFDALTGEQLGTHTLPIAFLDIEGFWAPLRDLIEHLRVQGFVAKDRRIVFVATVGEALEVLMPAPAAAEVV
ncbi:TIGR00730 family Rossman fold protein [Streptomyces sp. NPDC102381]|uniref:LOG family protein n=1 Tax=Streptomyces sp. NPDC102381 TaxID=3366164 RepID=UPI0038090FFB